MTAKHIRRVAAAMMIVATAASSATAFAQQQDAGGSAELSPTELEALFLARTDSARMYFTEADVEFVTGMISHHAQALVMSRMAPTHGASPSIHPALTRPRAAPRGR